MLSALQQIEPKLSTISAFRLGNLGVRALRIPVPIKMAVSLAAVLLVGMPQAHADDPRPNPSGSTKQVAGAEFEAAARLSPSPANSVDGTASLAAFLKPGVPEEITRAALRRGWVSDPAIRDFVGLTEDIR
jgi:hypothetical protein